jgi:hypothetical protein
MNGMVAFQIAVDNHRRLVGHEPHEARIGRDLARAIAARVAFAVLPPTTIARCYRQILKGNVKLYGIQVFVDRDRKNVYFPRAAGDAEGMSAYFPNLAKHYPAEDVIAEVTNTCRTELEAAGIPPHEVPHILIKGLWRLAVQPDLAEGSGIAEHDGAVHGVRCDRDEVRHEPGILPDIDAAEAWDAAASMRMHVEDGDAVIHGPLACAADRRSADHGADARVRQVVLVAHRPVFAGKDNEVVVRGGKARRDEADALVREGVWAVEVGADRGEQACGDLETDVHATALKCASSICVQRSDSGT